MWDWLSCTTPPDRRPGEDRAEIHGAGSGALAMCAGVLARGYPARTAREDDTSRTWWGWRAGDGELVAVLAARPATGHGSGVHLSAVTVVPELRRRGVASALTAAATRWGLAHGPLVHLGIWSDHAEARTLYTRLGYRVGATIENLEPGRERGRGWPERASLWPLHRRRRVRGPWSPNGLGRFVGARRLASPRGGTRSHERIAPLRVTARRGCARLRPWPVTSTSTRRTPSRDW